MTNYLLPKQSYLTGLEAEEADKQRAISVLAELVAIEPSLMAYVHNEEVRDALMSEVSSLLTGIDTTELRDFGKLPGNDEMICELIISATCTLYPTKQNEILSDVLPLHFKNVGALAEKIAQKIYGEVGPEVRIGGELHDVGKVDQGVRGVISNERALTDDEYTEMQKHSGLGYLVLDMLGVSEEVKEIALKHHEKLDGTGYPLGIGADQLPMAVRIVAAADTIDAILAVRPGRPDGLPIQVVMEVLKEKVGSKYDQEVVQAFIEVLVDAGMYDGEMLLISGETHLRTSDILARLVA